MKSEKFEHPFETASTWKMCSNCVQTALAVKTSKPRHKPKDELGGNLYVQAESTTVDQSRLAKYISTGCGVEHGCKVNETVVLL